MVRASWMRSPVKFEGISYIDPPEANLLEKYAQNVGKCGIIVEIGAYHGASTLRLARGARAANATVYSIDSHEHVEVDPVTKRNVVFTGDDNAVFMQNMLNHEVAHIVKVVNLRSEHAAQAFLDMPDFVIDLLFVDGGHSEEQVRRDVALYAPMVTGYLILHDSEWSGVKAVIAELTQNGWECVERAESTSVMRRKQGV